MADSENLGSFFTENKKLVKEWIDIRLEIYKLKLVNIFSRSAGYFIWIVISVFLLSLLIIFLGLTTGFWLSEITGSYARGFGLTSLILLAIILLIAALRKVLFVNPIIRTIIKKANEEADSKEEN
jgi:thiol:disulfide interchange protein